jgi:hypothetical protein
MYSTTLPCGKWRGYPLADVPTHYLKWALNGMDRLDDWTRDEVRQELRRRGERYAPAGLVLADLEETLTARISEDPLLDFAVAAIVSDHVLLAFEEVRDRHGVVADTQLVLTPWPRPCAALGDGRGEWAPPPWSR